MKKYRPKSWSEQARKIADEQIRSTLESGDPVWSLRFFSNSYRADIIRHRAAKRFGRAMRKAGVNIYDYRISLQSEQATKDDRALDKLFRYWETGDEKILEN